MLNPASVRALETIAARAEDVLRFTQSGAIPAFGDVRSTPHRFPDRDPLAVAPPPDALFVTERDGKRGYARDGAFAVREGALVNSAGAAILGFPVQGRPGVAVPLAISDVDRALGRAREPRIEADGTFAYTRHALDPATGEVRDERVAVGTLALARFAAGTDPRAAHAVPQLGKPLENGFGAVAQHTRETAAIDVDRAIERLQDAYLSFQAIGAAGRAVGGVEKTALDLVK